MPRALTKAEKIGLVMSLLPLAKESRRIEFPAAARILLEAHADIAALLDGMTVSHALRGLGYRKVQGSKPPVYMRHGDLPRAYLGQAIAP